jgi:4-alpha-glucanotransferase
VDDAPKNAGHGARRMSSHPKKTAGVLVPLFSVRTARSMGIGDIGDLPTLATWAKSHGHNLIQLLPLGELPDGETSPYASATGFAIDPMYVAVDRLEDVRVEDRDALLGPDGAAHVARMKQSSRVDYKTVRGMKRRILRAAFEHFLANDYAQKGRRAGEFREFQESERDWVEDYALFRACKQRFGESWWRSWPVGLREREPTVVERVRTELAHDVLHHQWVQWVAHSQWAEARKACNSAGVELMGDLPFMVGVDSADVWAHRKEFFVDASIGVPGDPWIPEGQDWGLPAYDWEAMDKNNLTWVRRRSRAMAKMFDRFRVDHLVGYYRMYVRPKGAPARWMPAEQPDQLARGEKVITALAEGAAAAGGKLVAEDLGTIPDWVRTSMRGLKLPGYRVIMWEKDGDTFRDPATYSYVSLATSGTHDTITLADWWEQLGYDERRHALSEIPSLRAVAAEREVDKLTPTVHAALLDALYGSGSELALIPIQDLFGTKDRVNTPATVGEANWTWQLPDDLENLDSDPKLGPRLRIATERAKAHRT